MNKKPLPLLPLDSAVFFPRSRGVVDTIRCHAEEAARVRVLCKQLRLVRPNGESPASVLLEAVACGLVTLVRTDDPEERAVRMPLMAGRFSTPNGNRGAANALPGAAAPVPHHAGRGCPADGD
jgi:hypothetical protein